MISLEEEIAKVTQDMLGKDLTSEDIMKFFECENEHIQRLIAIKELDLKHAQLKYDALGRTVPETNNTPLSMILGDLTHSLEVARLRFEDCKVNKSYELLKLLKLAVSKRQHDVINECLLDLQMLRECTKDFAIYYLEQQLAKYSAMAKEEGFVYLDYYSRQEQRESTLAEILEIKYQLIALNDLM